MTPARSLGALADTPAADAAPWGGYESWQRNVSVPMPAGVVALRDHMTAEREPVTRDHAVRIMGSESRRPDQALAVATWWLPGIYESDDGLVWLAGVVDDEAAR